LEFVFLNFYFLISAYSKYNNMKSIKFLCALTILFCSLNSRANNISISNVTSVPGSGYVQLQFDLSWENSWRSSTNYDAAWIFFKFKDLDGTWHHLSLTGSNDSSASGYTISVAPDLTGAMIYRSVNGSGNVSLTSVRLGVNNLPGSFDIKAFAIEMVQIPITDPYYLGDGESGTYYANNLGAPFFVNSSVITMGISAGQLNDGISNGVLASGFPDGYNTFAFSSLYMMKYELTQGAYRDFLNTLTYTQQTTRTAVAPNSPAGTGALGNLSFYRNMIQIAVSGVNATTPAVYGCNYNGFFPYDEAGDGEWIACNYLSWSDLAAYLDWSGLRPMTELEFEKSCRGPLTPVSGENATGTVAAANYTYPITNAGTASEGVTTSGSVLNANICYNSTSPNGNAPLRVGIFATQYATRISSGAGYYGCMELSGNIQEITVTTSNAAGRSFTGLHGDGSLNAAGDADVSFWPGINGNTTVTTANTAYAGTTGVTGAAGMIGRGGSAGYTGFNLNKVSYRVAPIGTYIRNNITGGRGVKQF
jgi:hypothetical protein